MFGHRLVLGWVILAVAALSGCGQLRSQRRDHESANILNTGPPPKITRRQSADVEIALGRSLEESGNLSEAEAAYRNALAKDPKRADAEQRLAILADERGDQVEAERRFERALKLDPKNPEILCDRGYNLYLQRRWSEAEETLRKALAADPRHARSRSNLGLVLAQRGDDDAALAEFLKAGCDPADARSNLALTQAMRGRFDDARKTYAEVLAAKPSLAAAREGLRAVNVAAAGSESDGSLVAQAPPPRIHDPEIMRTSLPQPPTTR